MQINVFKSSLIERKALIQESSEEDESKVKICMKVKTVFYIPFLIVEDDISYEYEVDGKCINQFHFVFIKVLWR